MGITMIPDQFDQDRRQDPKRAAEARVYDALQNLDHGGCGIYEFRYRRGGREVDVALWLDGLARFAVQVKGGQYDMDETGQWHLVRSDGRRDTVGSPLSATVDACMEMRNAVREATGFQTFVVGVLVFPDMLRNESMERAALNHKHVHIVWGLDDLSQDLRRIATREETITHPPEPDHSRNEWEAANRIQYRQDGAPREAAAAKESPATDPASDLPLGLEAATITIQHVDTLIIQRCPLHPETDPAGALPLGLESATITIQHVDTLIIQRCPLHPETEQDPGSPGA